MFWLQNPCILIKQLQLWPFCPGMSKEERYNALSRLVIIGGIIMSFAYRSFYPLLTSAVALAIIAASYYLLTKNKKPKMKQSIVNVSANAAPKTQKRELGPWTTLDGACDPYGNPNPYQKCIASNQKPLGMLETPIYGDQFIDKLYSGPTIRPPGLSFYRVPDTTTMARQPYPTGSEDASTTWLGMESNSGSLVLRNGN